MNVVQLREVEALSKVKLSRSALSKMAVSIEASLLQEDFVDFVHGAWTTIEPSTPLKWGWALEAICEHLVAVTDGQIKRLLINVPPGCMKSILLNVMWPAWEWTNPKLRYLRYVSMAHKQDLAIRDNLKCRRLIQSAWYQTRWPDVVLVSDQNQRLKFENSDTGIREATAFTSTTGIRGDRVLIDDPISVDGANSEADIKAAEITFKESLPTRVNGEDSAMVCIMQRVHEEDTSGIIINRKLGWEHLMLPMRFEIERKCTTSIGFSDPRTKDGELLFPERFSDAHVKSLEIQLGEYATAGQLQQRPAPRGGGMFKIAHLKLWSNKAELPDLMYVVQSYDTAFTDNTANDPTACTVWGVFFHPVRKLNCALLLHAWDEHLSYPVLRQRVIDDWTAEYGGRKTKTGHDDPQHPPRRPDDLLIETKGSGKSLFLDLHAANVPARSYNPGKADKFARASRSLALFDFELFYVLESVKEPEKPVAWARPFVDQMAKFGPGVTAHDDYCDTFSQMAILLRDTNLLALPKVFEEESEDKDYHKKRKNPYD